MNILTLTFSQSWTTTPQALNAGVATIQRVGDTLELIADLTDPAIQAPDAGFNDYAYTKGDVFELFIRGEGDSHYHELHISPTNAVLQLRFPKPREGNEKLDVEGAKRTQPLFDSSTERTEDGWKVRMSIPLKNICEQDPLPLRWQIACGRYDYREQPDGTLKAVIANTAPLGKADFHRIDEWPLYALGSGA